MYLKTGYNIFLIKITEHLYAEIKNLPVKNRFEGDIISGLTN